LTGVDITVRCTWNEMIRTFPTNSVVRCTGNKIVKFKSILISVSKRGIGGSLNSYGKTAFFLFYISKTIQEGFKGAEHTNICRITFGDFKGAEHHDTIFRQLP
jgi:hypothetical protein